MLTQTSNPRTSREPAVWLAVALAFLTAMGYLLIGRGVLEVGDIKPEDAPPAIVYAAAICYFAGGLLILLRRRLLWMVGTVVNGAVILFFVQLYLNRPEVMFSAGGVVTKSAQILLELNLLYLVVSEWTQQMRQTTA